MVLGNYSKNRQASHLPVQEKPSQIDFDIMVSCYQTAISDL